ncbi:MAG: hypothetical protein OEZ39_09155 [Gammaproteobacteria bacterium]|nr:hypothetical protein [Gammaproteobacteria bacterium]MDH5652011.1 hypothetical protein [Gammaproteobacteria bacterium]
MDYRQFQFYRDYRPAGLSPLDDLDPVPLKKALQAISVADRYTFAEPGWFVKRSTGVRALLQELYFMFSRMKYTAVLPEDIYPVYFHLLPDDMELRTYRTLGMQRFELPIESRCVAVIADPMMPSGSYLHENQIVDLLKWLDADPERRLIVDTVYNFSAYTVMQRLDHEQVIFLGSVAKLLLSSGELGWAVSRSPLPGFEKTMASLMVESHGQLLQQWFDKAWQDLTPQLTEVALGWKKPEVGYLSVVPQGYKQFEENGLAVIPAGVFGSKQDLSVVSCLARVKENVL